MINALVTIEVFAEPDIYAGRVHGAMEFAVLPRSGESVSFLLEVAYLGAEIAAGFTGQLRVLEVTHTPRRGPE